MTGLQEKQLGLYHVESSNKALVGLARNIAREICGRQGKVSIDDVRSDTRMAGFEPTSPNVWGTIWNEEGWRCVERRFSTRKSNHHREIKVWEWIGHETVQHL